MRKKPAVPTIRTTEALTPEEIQVLDEAVLFINGHLNSAARSLIEVGQFLLDRFYEGDPAKAKDRAPRKGLSLRKLAQRPDLDCSYASLSNAVSLAVQERFLGDHLKHTDGISETHKLLLLHADGDAKLAYAKRITKDSLSCRQLRELLIEDGVIQPPGRPALTAGHAPSSAGGMLPTFEFLAPLTPLASLSLDSLDLDDLPPESVAQALDQAVKAQKNLAALIRRLKAKT